MERNTVSVNTSCPITQHQKSVLTEKLIQIIGIFLKRVFFSSVSQATDSHRTADGQTDHALNSSSYPVTQAGQSPPYTTPLSTKTELRSTRDHHVVDVRQQNTVVPPPQQAHARSDKPSKLEILKIFLFFLVLKEK